MKIMRTNALRSPRACRRVFLCSGKAPICAGMASQEIETLAAALARLPGLGPRSARRAVLWLVKRRESALPALLEALAIVGETLVECETCGNVDTTNPCGICADPRRDGKGMCVVEDVADLWAMERTGAFKGRYHVLGGLLSALDAVGPDELGLPRLAKRVADDGIAEVILALGATVDGQTTAHYVADLLEGRARVTTLAQGVPVGGELDYLDDGTIGAALKSRRSL